MSKIMSFNTLEDVIECYGRNNLIAIDCLPQIIFYTRNGCQPKFVCENETKRGKVTFWFHKGESNYVYRMWMNNRPTK